MKKVLHLIFLPLLSYSSEKAICHSIDNRIPSFEPEIGRSSAKGKLTGCTATLISKNCVITAGHCIKKIDQFAFNVPPSINRTPQPSAQVDIYYVNPQFIRYQVAGKGHDWAVIKVKKNSITGLFPGEKQGYLQVNFNNKINTGEKIRITGYGEDSTNPVQNYIQQVDFGYITDLGGGLLDPTSKLTHNVDTMTGNSGSAIILEKSNEVIAIHTHGQCQNSTAINTGTLISKNTPFKRAILNCIKLD